MARPIAGSPELLTSAEVAALLRVHPKQVYRLLARGLPARRVGAGWRFTRSDVLSWADADGHSTRAEEAPVTPRAGLGASPPLLAANGDVAVETMLAAIARRGPPLLGFVASDRGTGLLHLGSRAVLMAGYHAGKPPSHLGTERLARIRLVVREVGLGHRAATPTSLKGVLRKKRLASRPPTAGVRAHLDAALVEAHASLATLGVRCREHGSHRDAVTAVLRNEADVALTTSAWAERAGLAFMALANEPYDLLLYAGDLGDPASVVVCETLQTAAFKKELGRIAGYDARRTGDIRYEFASD